MSHPAAPPLKRPLCVRGSATIEPSDRGTVRLCVRRDAKWSNIVDWMMKTLLDVTAAALRRRRRLISGVTVRLCVCPASYNSKHLYTTMHTFGMGGEKERRGLMTSRPSTIAACRIVSALVSVFFLVSAVQTHLRDFQDIVF